MKAPADLRAVLRRQWDNADKREARLLGGPSEWPVTFPIGRPQPRVMSNNLEMVKRHLQRWRNVTVGNVLWEEFNYRSTAAPVSIPFYWEIRQPSDWIAACGDQTIREEFELLAACVEQVDEVFHRVLIRRRSLWRGKSLAEVLQAARLASALEPCSAAGRPLRMLSVEGIDTKFFERNARLVTNLLDARFDGEPGRIGLETFLGATSENDHWLLVMDLDKSLLPFRKQRIRSSELKKTSLPGARLLIVENEACQFQLPDLPETIAVLGTGFDLDWVAADWLKEKQVGYWGDIDTWGLQCLATARQSLPHLEALLMSSEIFDAHRNAAVVEPVPASTEVPRHLMLDEKSLYARLLKENRGRLEQEFLSESVVHAALNAWA